MEVFASMSMSYGVVVFVSGLMTLLFNWGHIMTSLMSIEFMVLSVYLVFSLEVASSEDTLSVLFFIAFAVCEGCLGLSVLAMNVFSKGSDSMSLLTYLRW